MNDNTANPTPQHPTSSCSPAELSTVEPASVTVVPFVARCRRPRVCISIVGNFVLNKAYGLMCRPANEYTIIQGVP